jgi:hypothetical protein
MADGGPEADRRYFLATSSARLDSGGFQDTFRIALFVVLGAWLCAAVATGRGPTTAARRRTWWLPPLLFVAGAFVDAILRTRRARCSAASSWRSGWP